MKDSDLHVLDHGRQLFFILGHRLQSVILRAHVIQAQLNHVRRTNKYVNLIILLKAAHIKGLLKTRIIKRGG